MLFLSDHHIDSNQRLLGLRVYREPKLFITSRSFNLRKNREVNVVFLFFLHVEKLRQCQVK